MADNKNSFIVYAADIKETLDKLTDDQVAELFRGMVDYQITGESPEFSGVLEFAFIPIRQQMDRDNTKWERTREKRVESGRQGGIRSGEVRKAKAENEANEASASKSKQTNQNEANEANEAVNVNVNVNDNVNVNGNVNVSDSFEAGSDGPAPLSSLLISYLNEKAGTNYNVTAAFVQRIWELMDAGYTADDMKSVIDKKVSEWKDSDKMRGYIRPRTLFGDKFEEYVSAPVPLEIENQQKEEEKRWEIAEKLQEERSSKSESLSSILGRIQVIRDGPVGIKGAWKEFKELNDRKIVLEQDLEFIDKKLGRLET